MPAYIYKHTHAHTCIYILECSLFTYVTVCQSMRSVSERKEFYGYAKPPNIKNAKLPNSTRRHTYIQAISKKKNPHSLLAHSRVYCFAPFLSMPCDSCIGICSIFSGAQSRFALSHVAWVCLVTFI